MLPPDSSVPTAENAAIITPDAMARILEPRVRSNAKNNSKIAKPVAPPKPDAGKTGTGRTVSARKAPEAEMLLPTKVATAATATAPVLAVPAPSSAADADIAAKLSEMRDLMVALQENQSSRDRAFDLLYEELSGYKNDFYLERLKPTLRALLFLLDSIEGFGCEIDGYKKNGVALTSELVEANLLHFRDQLTDILTLSEMTPVPQDGDKFDPKTQRAIEVVPVEVEQNNTVQRQIRGGWRLSGKMLRPADVVVGRSG